MEKTDRISELVNTPGVDENLHCTMLKEDLSCSIFTLNRLRLDVELFIDDEQVSEEAVFSKIEKLFKQRRDIFSRRDSELMTEIIARIWSLLIYNGICVYEVVNENDVVSFYPVRNVLKINTRYVFQQGINNVVKVPINKCLVLRFPENILSFANYKELFYELNALEETSPRFNFLKNENLHNSLGYNYEKHLELYDLYYEKLVNKLSWNSRNSSYDGENLSFFYMLRRALIFKKNKIIILEQILQFLNSIFKDYFPEIRLEVNQGNDTTSEFFQERIKDLESGKLTMEEINDLLRISI